MSRQFSLIAEVPPSVLLPAAADAAGRTSRYASLANCDGKAFILVEVNQGNAATVQLTVLQAQNNAGLNSKAVNAMPISLNDDTSISDAFAAQAAAANFTTDANLKDKLVLFEILPEAAMDMANGFDHIAIQTGASNAANITSAKLLYTARIKALGASQPSTFN